MTLERKYSIYRKIAVFVAINFLVELFAPTAVWALTGGPASPEFASFEPVATTNLVNEFTGDMTYNLPVINIPGANGGGYAMSLSYHSGVTPEEEASWVGYGWTLNPGAINRGKKGFPDDWKQTNVKYWNKTPANETVTIGGSLGNPEAFSNNATAQFIENAGINVNSNIRYNNYRGFGYSIGSGVSLGKGVVSLGFNVTDGSGSFSFRLNPASALRGFKNKGEENDKETRINAIRLARDKRRKAIKDLKGKNEDGSKLTKEQKDNIREEGGLNRSALSGLGSGYGLHNFVSESRPTQIVDYNGISTNLSLGFMATPLPIPVAFSADVSGSYSRQENVPTNNLLASGYMYSSNANEDGIMDYYVEKGSIYSKQDKFLGIPFNNADNYALTGEGLSGGFKLAHRTIGQFRPNHIKSATNIFNVGAEVEAGLNWGGGADIGIGRHTLEIEGWSPSGNTNGFSDEAVDESVFFRFANDRGGHLSYDNGNTVEKQANVEFTNGIAGIKSAIANVSGIESSIKTDDNNYSRSLRSSYIGYNTNTDLSAVEGTVAYRAYAKNVDDQLTDGIGVIDRSNGDLIGEFSIVNEDGARYSYGIPVLSRREKNLQVDLNGIDGSNIKNRFLVYRDVTGPTETKVGEERDSSYATSYLLTSITSSDYIDRTNNGPTDDDFGGYTKFSYEKAFGAGVDESLPLGEDDWYKWRMPYAGLSYNRNELSNPKDDLGSVAEGEKEVYYLKRIDTKTHYAIFYSSNRTDGLDAEHDEAIASTTEGAKGNFHLKKLDRIELFAKDPNDLVGATDKPIKTVRFEYDYSLAQGVLNSSTGEGKLTLKRVWFEFDGIVEANISPYQFEYEYPQSTNSSLPNYVDYPARYDSLENFGAPFNQNPNYSEFDIDAWGNYQNDGAARFADLKPWLNQNALDPVLDDFDPAAWQLKVIKLPSGGEIHVQYEQDDYCYVQDKQAHAMVSLLDNSGGSNHNNGTFVINTGDLGIVSQADREKLAAIINKEYIVNDKKMYFKMLYKLIGSATPNLNDCNAEYISGYASVASVNATANGIEIRLRSNGYSLPRQVCEDYVTTQRAGNLSAVGSNCEPTPGRIVGGNTKDKILGFIGQAATWLASLAPNTTCLEVNYPFSYLKVPLLNAKKGGGVRVKRLLMYDKGIDTGAPVLFGSEYIYQAFDEERKEFRSSGVATNEPISIREENALVGFMERFKQGFLDKAIAGRDREQSEGPLGESILPNPSVGYSRVITKSIHSGITNPGLTISEFHTAKQFPLKKKMTKLDRDNKDYLPILTGLVNKVTNNLWVSQGFSFEINNMHGQLKSTSTYAGDYSDILNPIKSELVSQEVITYFEPGEDLPILNPKDLSMLPSMPLGREMDLVMESRAVKDIKTDGNIEFDADVGVFGILLFPFLSAFPSMTFSETELYTHVTTKVISYPAIVKSTTSYADGIYHISENVAFSSETGQPIKVRTTDGFDDLNLLASNNHDGNYVQYSFPASLEYENVSQIAKNERRIVKSDTDVSIDKIEQGEKTYLSFSVENTSSTVCDALSNFVGGELVELSTGGVYHVGEILGSKIEIQPTNYSTATAVEEFGIDVEIIRSGRTNQLNTNVGSLTTYGNSNVTVSPIDPGVIAERQQFADLLTDALTGVVDTIFPQDIPAGVTFKEPNGTCGTLETDEFILIQGNQVNVYRFGEIINQDTVTVGTTANPHPMVDSLNSYLNTFYRYPLDTMSSPIVTNPICSAADTFVHEDISNSSPDVQLMRSEQTAFLNQVFDSVKGTTHTIADFFEDDGFSLGFTNTILSVDNSGPSPVKQRINSRMILREIATGLTFGGYTGCAGSDVQICFAFNPDICIPFPLPSILFLNLLADVPLVPLPIGQFFQVQDFLVHFKAEGVPNPVTVFPNVRFYNLENGEQTVELLCSSTLDLAQPLMGPVAFGNFDIDPQTGSLVYFAADNPCFSQPVSCIEFCDEVYPSTVVSNVVASEATTLSDRWNYDASAYPNPSLVDNDYESGMRGKWRTQRTYAFKTDVDGVSSSPVSFDKNYNSGTYDLELFNWQNEGANGPKWLALNTVSSYSPNGNALEEENILGVKSSAKFGYSKTLPYLIAQNADFNTVAFESFENTYAGNLLEDGVVIDSEGSIDASTSHSGKRSLKINTPINDGIAMKELVVNNQILNEGLLFKVWVKTDFSDRTVLDQFLKAELKDVGNNLLVSQLFEKVAQVGEWYLYEAKVLGTNFSGMAVGDPLKTFVKYEFTNHASENVWIDDVRIQPMDAQTTAFVYDVVTHRLITSFDDQHFGLFFQYNAEGKLVRKLIETERGIKTVQESQFNTPKIARTN